MLVPVDTVQVVEDASGTAQFKISRIDKVHAHTQTLFAQGADHHIKPQVPLCESHHSLLGCHKIWIQTSFVDMGVWD